MTVSDYNDCVKMHADDVYRFAYKSVGGEDDAKDIVQQCFEILWEKRMEVEFGKAKSYLFTIANRKSIDHYRNKSKLTDIEQLKDTHLGARQPDYGLKKALDLALAGLPIEQRNLVALKDIEGYSYEEIAKISGLNLSQVKVYLFRARKELQKILLPYKYHI